MRLEEEPRAHGRPESLISALLPRVTTQLSLGWPPRKVYPIKSRNVQVETVTPSYQACFVSSVLPILRKTSVVVGARGQPSITALLSQVP